MEWPRASELATVIALQIYLQCNITQKMQSESQEDMKAYQ